jgi:hypothetical protein
MAGLFGRKPSDPVKMPDPEDPEARAASERERTRIAARSGRTSTILSRRSSPGTRAYENSLLGQAG